jgi:hypothetical protein
MNIQLHPYDLAYRTVLQWLRYIDHIDYKRAISCPARLTVYPDLLEGEITLAHFHDPEHHVSHEAPKVFLSEMVDSLRLNSEP